MGLKWYNNGNLEGGVPMTLEEMLNRKRELGYSNETLARLSGVPLGTVQKVMAGLTKSPRQKTLEALAQVLIKKERNPTDSQSVEHNRATACSETVHPETIHA